jgi:hypothetical protein
LNPVHRLSPLQTKFGAVLLSLVLAGGGLEMARAPRLVSFADSSSAPLLQASTSVVRSRIAPTAVPAMYRDASRPHATLVDAVMPARNSHSLSHAVGTRRRPVQNHVHKAHITGVPKQPGLLLTTASVPSEPIASGSREQIVRTIYVLPTGFPPSYAAVAFRDGWLIIQL